MNKFVLVLIFLVLECYIQADLCGSISLPVDEDALNWYRVNKWFVIKNPKSGLVLDASEHEVKLQRLDESYKRPRSSQLWKLKLADSGTFYIVNKANTKVMHIRDGEIRGADVITEKKSGKANQKWILNSDKTIVSSTQNLALELHKKKFKEGTKIIAEKKLGAAESQKFIFEYY